MDYLRSGKDDQVPGLGISFHTHSLLPLAPYVSTMPLQKIPPSDNIIFFAEMDGQGPLGGATFGFFRSFDLRLQSGL